RPAPRHLRFDIHQDQEVVTAVGGLDAHEACRFDRGCELLTADAPYGIFRQFPRVKAHCWQPPPSGKQVIVERPAHGQKTLGGGAVAYHGRDRTLDRRPQHARLAVRHPPVPPGSRATAAGSPMRAPISAEAAEPLHDTSSKPALPQTAKTTPLSTPAYS